jgi:hypothetical protein
MKYIKKYESISNIPEVGDYMLVNTNLLDSGRTGGIPDIFTPFQTLAFYRIGKITSVKKTGLEQVLEIRADYSMSDVRRAGPPFWYNTPPNKTDMLKFDGKTYYVEYTLPYNSIIHSKNREDLEPYIQSNKFNI